MTSTAARPPINWPGAIILLGTPLAALILIPWYAVQHGFSMAAWISFSVFLAWSGLGITAGYHRLWAHKAYEAKWPVRFMLMLGGTLALQNSILFWASSHRTHHRHVDHVDNDPYSVKRGFWYAHIGWMLRNYPSGTPDYKNAPDLVKDKLVMFQHRHYIALVILTNIVFPLILGWMVGDIAGVMLLAGLLRLIVSHHVTFFINSLCHMFGKQPYTDENTARDNFWLALLTWGEGYHNFHHIFQFDYRNGVKWWQYDPTKWLILGLSKLGLTYNLKRIPSFTIRKAEIAMKFKRAETHLATYGHDMHEDIIHLRQRISQEYDAFTHTLNDWAKLKEQSIEAKKAAVAEKIQQADLRLKSEFQLLEQRMHEHGKRLEIMMFNMQRLVRRQTNPV